MIELTTWGSGSNRVHVVGQAGRTVCGVVVPAEAWVWDGGNYPHPECCIKVPPVSMGSDPT